MHRRVLLLTAIPAVTLVSLAVLAEPVTQPFASPATDHTRTTIPSLDVLAVQGGSEDVSLSVSLDRSSVLQGTDGLVRAEVTLRSERTPDRAARVPTDLVVVLDASGSMEGSKLIEAQQAATELLSSLTPEDRFALVRYSGMAHVEIPLTSADAESRAAWARTIQGIQANGSTNMQAGLDVGAAVHSPQPARVRRTILISDGLPDTPDGLVEQARSSARAETPVTAVGIGDDYDEQLMTRLADAGTGNFYWVRQGQDLAAVFADEFSTARETHATSLAISHSGSNGIELVGAAGYTVTDGSFSIGSMYAGQERRLWLTFKVPAEVAAEDLDIGQLAATWRTLDSGPLTAAVHLPAVNVVEDRSQFIASIDADSWGDAVITEEYNRMRVEVSKRVQAGDREGALSLIDSYATANADLNNDVKCDAVWDNLDETAELRTEVEASFTGADQSTRQNVISKSLNFDAYSTRRAGQSKRY